MLFSICIVEIETVLDENKRKEAGNWPILKNAFCKQTSKQNKKLKWRLNDWKMDILGFVTHTIRLQPVEKSEREAKTYTKRFERDTESWCEKERVWDSYLFLANLGLFSQ